MMGKVLRGAQETEFLLKRWLWGLAARGGFAFESLLEDMTDPGHVDKINRQGTKAGCFGSLPAVTFRQPQ